MVNAILKNKEDIKNYMKQYRENNKDKIYELQQKVIIVLIVIEKIFMFIIKINMKKQNIVYQEERLSY